MGNADGLDDGLLMVRTDEKWSETIPRFVPLLRKEADRGIVVRIAKKEYSVQFLAHAGGVCFELS